MFFQELNGEDENTTTVPDKTIISGSGNNSLNNGTNNSSSSGEKLQRPKSIFDRDRPGSRSSLIEKTSGLADNKPSMTSSSIEFSRSSMKESSSSSKSDVAKEVKKPAWLQELSNKQASRNSEVFETGPPFNRTLEKAKPVRPVSQPVPPPAAAQPPPIVSEKPSLPTKPSQIDPKPGRTSEPVSIKPSQLFLDGGSGGKPGRISEPTKGSSPETPQKPTTPDHKPEFLRPKPAADVITAPSKVQLAKQSLNNQLNNNSGMTGAADRSSDSLVTDSNDNHSIKAETTAAIVTSSFTAVAQPTAAAAAAAEDHPGNRKKSFSEIRNERNSVVKDSYINSKPPPPSEVAAKVTDKSGPSSPSPAAAAPSNIDVVLKVRDAGVIF